MGNDSPLESLKAQAVAARSEAIIALTTLLYSGENFDLTSDVECQAFTGGFDDTSVLNIANIKSRLRMTMLYAHSSGRLVLGTSNYSEILVGYWTKWGDGAADLLPIARLFKDEVRKIAAALDLPRRVIDRVPSAGLWPGQSDEEEMGVCYRDIRSYFDDGDISRSAEARIQKMVESTEHKRNPIVYFNARKWMEDNG